MNTNKDWQKDYPIIEEITSESLDDNSSLKKMLDLVGEDKEVVDFGCATGYFSSLLQKKGCTVTGVEINVDAAKVAEQYCQQVIVADLDFVSVMDILPSQKFDVVVFGDILEHLRNPWKVLADTKEILKEDGYVIASIPNIAHTAIRLSLLQGRFDYTDFGILDNSHIRFFTRKTVKELFVKAGYLADIVDCTKLDSFSESHLIPQNTRSEFNIETIERIEEDEDCDTLQFIIRSYPYSRSQLQKTQSELDQVQSQLQKTQSELDQVQSQLQETQSELDRVQSQLQTVSIRLIKLENSLSMKITIPLRMVAMLLRGQFRDFKKVGLSLTPQKISNRLAQINRLSSILIDKPELLNNFGSKSSKAIKRIITGRSDLVIEGIRQHLYNKSVEETIELESNISVEGIIILATKHTQYIAHLLQKSLSEVGYESSLSEEFEKDRDIGQMYFVICPQMFSTLPKNFVAFQLEQSVSPRWFTTKYFSELSRAYCIFEYSVKNIEFLLKNDISYNKIFYLPIGSFPEYRKYLESINYQIVHTGEPIEILFYGDPTCPRRQMYLEKLNTHFNVHVASEVFGEKLISLICQAKVVVNIHYYEGSLLETTRIHETLSLGTPIVSESSIDIDNHTDLNRIVSFTPIGDIDAMISELYLLLSDDSQRQRRLDISQFLKKDYKFSNYFKRFLLSNDLFDYDFNDYVREVDLIKISQDIPRLCLSLTETPVRKHGFLSKPTYNFEIIEGIRYSDGWIGCGMSYKYILNKINQSKSKYALVCEDDVIFPDNFETKISNVLSYLQQTNHQWHIFSGLIADIHPETNILAIEEYKGVEYIYIDRMTSTVMNIYSPEIMEIIKLWDQTNKDANSNTIDRYIESQIELVVVTNLPYLVGHAEDKISTLWGFVNTQYSEMIEMSQAILAEKVIQYKSNL